MHWMVFCTNVHMVDCGVCHCGGIRDRGLFSSVVLTQVLSRSRGHSCRTLRGTGCVSTLLRVFLTITERRWQRLGSHRHPRQPAPRLTRQQLCTAVLPPLRPGLRTVGADPLPVCCASVAGPPREVGTSPPHAAEHEGVMSSGGVKKIGMPSICVPPRAAGGKKEGTHEVQLCIQQLVLNMSTSR